MKTGFLLQSSDYAAHLVLFETTRQTKSTRKKITVLFVLVLIGLLMILYDLRKIVVLCFCVSRHLMVPRTFYYAMLHLCVRTYCCLVVSDMLCMFYYLG